MLSLRAQGNWLIKMSTNGRFCGSKMTGQRTERRKEWLNVLCFLSLSKKVLTGRTPSGGQKQSEWGREQLLSPGSLICIIHSSKPLVPQIHGLFYPSILILKMYMESREKFKVNEVCILIASLCDCWETFLVWPKARVDCSSNKSKFSGCVDLTLPVSHSHIWRSTRKCMHIETNTYTHIHICIYTYLYLYTYKHRHAHMNTQAWTHTHTTIHNYSLSHTHRYNHS